MSPTSIAWVRGPDGAPGFTWSPVIGCSSCSRGCQSCWAARLASTRLAHLPEYHGLAKDGKWIGGARFLPDRLDQPMRKRKPAGIAVGLMGDLFHEGITDAQIAAVFGVMAACPQHRFFVLTKRAKRMREWFTWVDHEDETSRLRSFSPKAGGKTQAFNFGEWPLPNVWLGVSIEDQVTADERIPELLQTPAAVRFVSAEPLIAPVDLCEVVMPDGDCLGTGLDNLGGTATGLDWVIAGGMSGPQSAPCHVEWIRSIVKQCKAAWCACFVKQLGAHSISDNDDDRRHCGDMNLPKNFQLCLRDRAGADPGEWPDDLRVRQWPEVTP